MPWTPLLGGASAARARATLDEIGRRLLGPPIIPALGKLPALLSSFANGLPGLALAHAAIAEVAPEHADEHLDAAQARIEAAVGALGALGGEAGLSRGFSGVAFALATLGALDDDAAAAFDGALDDELSRGDALPHELMLGLAGRAAFARDRNPALFARLTARLVAEAEPQSGELLAWRTLPDPRWQGPDKRTRWPNGWFDLGVAHGMPALIATLAHGDAAAREAARRGLAWMWTQARPDGGFAAIAGEPTRAPTGWCYGGDGIAASLSVAAARLGDERSAARCLALAIGEPADDDRGAGLCHGAFGRAHLAHRLWQASGDPALRALAETRLATALALPLPEESGLLDGLAGVALVIAAALSDVEPTWDRALALS